MPRKFIILLVIAAVLVQTFSKGLMLVSYYTNTGIYAANCINKAKPKLHCNGKCQLAKKMQQEEKQEQKNTKGAEPQVVLFNEHAFSAVLLKPFELTAVQQWLPLTIGAELHSSKSVFHPPAA